MQCVRQNLLIRQTDQVSGRCSAQRVKDRLITAGIIGKSGKVFQCRRVARWQPRTAAPAQTHALPLTLPLFAFATQVFDSRVGGGSVQRLGAATVVLAGDRGRVASTCGSERGQRDLRGAQDAPPASLHHRHMQTSLSGICLRTMVTPVMCPPSAMRKVWRQRTCRVA